MANTPNIVQNGYYIVVEVREYATYADFYDVFGNIATPHAEINYGLWYMAQSTSFPWWGEDYCTATSTGTLVPGWYRYTSHLGTRWCSSPTLAAPISVGAPITAGHSVLEPPLPACIPLWQCEQPFNGYENDGCGNRRLNPACNYPVYREATLVSCQWPTGTLVAGQAYQTIITVNQGSAAENYKLVFSGDFVGESLPLIVNAGTGQQQFTIGTLIFTTGGQKNVTANLVKI